MTICYLLSVICHLSARHRHDFHLIFLRESGRKAPQMRDSFFEGRGKGRTFAAEINKMM